MAKLDHRELSDPALIVAIGRFDDGALAEVYRRHSGAVYALARRVLIESDAPAEEIVQEVFVRLWDNPERFDPARGSLRSFLLTETHGRTVDLVRSESSRRRREERDLQRGAVADYDLEREVGDVIVAEQVREALSALPGAERRAIELAYFGGHSYRDVAQLLDEPEGTIKSRIRSGLTRLRQAMVAVGIEVP